MHEARKYPRIPFRMLVDVYDESTTQPSTYQTRDIGLDGLFALKMLGRRPGQRIHLSLGGPHRNGLHLNAEVSELTADGAAIVFVDNSAATLEMLETLLAPKWDGNNLLEGVVGMAPWDDSRNLAGWMRLTSLVSDWHRLTRVSTFR
jgi:hypothetical protein